MDGLAGRSIWINRFNLNKRLSALPRDCGVPYGVSMPAGSMLPTVRLRSSLRFLQLLCNR